MIVVCSLSDLYDVCENINPSHVISVIDPGHEPDTPKGVKNHLKLGFDDIIEVNNKNSIYRLNNTEVDQVLPSKDHIKSIVNFLSSWNNQEPIVIHCWCGVSRSMATATYLLCKEDQTNIDRNIKYIRSIAPHANPNKLMINYFEKTLNIEKKISESYIKNPHTKSYDCAINFAPITIFDIKDMKDFK